MSHEQLPLGQKAMQIGRDLLRVGAKSAVVYAVVPDKNWPTPGDLDGNLIISGLVGGINFLFQKMAERRHTGI